MLDVNDNEPEFSFPVDTVDIAKGRYFAAIPRTSQYASSVLQVKAADRDTGKFGKLEYKILEGRGSNYFAIDSSSGIVRMAATFDDVDPSELPFKFDVSVRDNADSATNSNEVIAPVVVNLIGEENLLILVVKDASPEVMQREASRIAKHLSVKTGLLVDIDRITARKVVTKNGTLDQFPMDSDVWFYAVDPEAEVILNRNSTRLQRSVLEKPAMSNITFDVSTLVRANVVAIRAPVTPTEPVRTTTTTHTAVAFSGEVFPYALIVIACIILILGVAGIVYICVSWSR